MQVSTFNAGTTYLYYLTEVLFYKINIMMKICKFNHNIHSKKIHFSFIILKIKYVITILQYHKMNRFKKYNII